jgi:hypothetical protein
MPAFEQPEAAKTGRSGVDRKFPVSGRSCAAVHDNERPQCWGFLCGSALDNAIAIHTLKH